MYGLKYRCLFDPIANILSSPVCLLEILQKDYSGGYTNVTGSTIPVLQQWETDDPKAPIKGCSLSISLINDGSLPLSSFFSTEDDTFKVHFSVFGQTLFEGFLVQDDCSETLVDFTHEINLSANDNLGLLKDVSLDRANIFSLSYTSEPVFVGADFNSRYFLVGVKVPANVGDKIRITGTGTIDSDYTINKITFATNSSGDTLSGIYVDEPLAANYTGNAVYSILTPANLLDKTPLSTILRMCLSVTDLQLKTDVYGKIIETSQDATKSFLEQTLIDPQTFLKSDTEYTDCYDVLEKILSRFNMTLFQAYGVWNIVRWDELRYYDNLLEGFRYNYDFSFIGPVTKAAPDIIGEALTPETGLLRKICRPFLYDKETFNYQYPRQLLRNFDLKQLGSLIRTYSTGSGVDLKNIEEYEAKWWEPSLLPVSTKGNYFIRITSDDLGNEIERVLVVKGDTLSFPIEVNKGDSFVYSFSFKTQDSQPGNVTVQCIVELNDGITRKFFHNPALTSGTNMWQSGAGFAFQILSGDNTNQWHGVEIDTSRHTIPYDGLLYCYLRVADLGGTINETYYKDIRFQYTARINESTKIIGQTHQSSQAGVIKNTSEEEIFLDSSPRNSISGTLFLDEKIGVLQKRTEKWKHPYLTQSKNLGGLMTYEQMFWRQKPRSILEGTLYGAIQIGKYISLLSVLRYFSDKNFVFGTLEIDYKNNKANGTLWEMWEDNEANPALNYKFEYLYSTE